MDTSINSIMDSLRRITRALRNGTRLSERGTGLTVAQLFVLQQLHPDHGLSLNELAERTYSHQSTVSVIVNDLVKRGYIRRSNAKEDRRRLVLQPSASGRRILKKRQPVIQDRFIAALKAFSPKEQRQLSALLSHFVGKAGLEGESPHFFFENERR